MTRARSNVAGVVWPAMADAVGNGLMALQWQFSISERWPAGRLASAQLAQLSALVAHCAENVPFWRGRLAAADMSASTLTWETWRRLPILSRAEARAAGSGLHAAPLPTRHGKIARLATSGSTGEPLVGLKTELSQFFFHGALLRELLWHDWEPAWRMAVIRDDGKHIARPPDGLARPTWGPPVSHLFPTGPLAMLDIQAPVAVQAAWLLRQDPDILLTWPSNLTALAQHCRDRRIRPARLRVVRTLAETVTPALRALVREAWGVAIVDSYSAEETGTLALQCPSGTHYHLQAEDALAEVLDEDGAPCGPGEVGQVVVTPLHNFAMPLLRYAIGDDAQVGEPCGCGRTLLTLARIVGRTRDRLRLPNGHWRFAYNPSEAFAQVPAIRRYQIAQVAADTLDIRLQAQGRLTDADGALLADALAAALGHRFALRFVYVDAFPRAAGQKFRDVVCEIA